jgi:CRP-like cAMP-binding protein
MLPEDKPHQFILSNFAKHIKLDRAETSLVVSRLQYKNVKKNEVLLQAGEVSRNIHFVNHGCLRIFNTDNEGVEHIILLCPEGWWAADISSFSEQTPAYYTISALEDTGIFYLSFEALEQLYKDVPKLERFFRILVQNGFNLYQRRITMNLANSAKERYAHFEKQYPGLERRIAQKHIASFLGITTVFLSMIRRPKRSSAKNNG